MGTHTRGDGPKPVGKTGFERVSPASCIKPECDDEVISMALHQASKSLRSDEREPLYFTLGTAVLCCIVLCLGARPLWMPWLYLGFAAVGLPMRVVSFTKKGYGFFLLDYCYVSPRCVYVMEYL